MTEADNVMPFLSRAKYLTSEGDMLMGRLSQNICDGRCQRHAVRQCLMVLALTLVASSAAAQNLWPDTCYGSPESPSPLSAGGATVTRSMKGNERHVYELTLLPNQYVQVVVEQKGVDVILGLRDPSD